MRSTCSRTTTPSSTLRNPRVSARFSHSCPSAQFSVRENLLVVTGAPETKELKELMPDILKQVGPQQYQYLKNLGGEIEGVKNEAEADDDDVPELVGTFEDAGKK
jgi:hypothetical protein